ncbi:MAG: L-fucose mutarotase [Clostridia bacterium]|nr:L-fucose mutarotase [Clostridia bacterium]
MLKGISPILSPVLLKVLCEMGHGDYLVLADANFPVESIGKDAVIVRADGIGIPDLLRAMLPLFPLDTYVAEPVQLMQAVPGDPVETPIWDEYRAIVKEFDGRGADVIGETERFAFYEKARGAYAIIATGERAVYGNIILQKGVVTV